MREALRRALWLIPTVLVVSLLAFWVATRNVPAPPGEEGIPVLFNARPNDVEALTWRAALGIAQGGTEQTADTERLLRIGGAALPYLLPKLDTLDPTERQRVALALMPLATRMQLSDAESVRDGEAAVQFWAQFWQDHFVDFKPTVTRRAVSRFGTRATPQRQKELLRLDTYALDELVKQMEETEDGAILRRLTAAASHIAMQPWTIAAEASREELRDGVERWLSWWARQRSQYVAAQGLERFVAPLLETRYALWLEDAARTRFGRWKDGRPALAVLASGTPLTFSLLLTGLLGGSLLGLGSGAVLFTSARLWVNRLSTYAALLWIAVPTPLLLGYATGESFTLRLSIAALVLGSLGGGIALVYARLSWRQLAERPGVLARLFATKTRLGRAWFIARENAQHTLRGMTTQSPTLLGCVFLAEYAFDLPGWGQKTIQAVLGRELSWLMLMVIATAVLLGLVHVAAAVGQSLISTLLGDAHVDE